MSLSPLDLLDSGNYQTYNRAVAKELGSIYAAIMLSELVNRYNYHRNRNKLFTPKKHEGLWFYYTIELCEERTLLSRKSQDTTIRILEERNLFTKATIGVPGKRHFRLNLESIEALINVSNKHSRMSPTDKVQCPQRTNPYKELYKEPYGNNNSTPKPPSKKPLPPKPAAVPPAAAAQAVVVFSCLDQLNLSESFKDEICTQYSKEAVEKACKAAEQQSPQNLPAFLRTALKQGYEPNQTQEDVESYNKGWTDVNFKDGERRGCYTVSISPTYLEMIQPGAGHGNKTFAYKDKEFRHKVESFFDKNNLKKRV